MPDKSVYISYDPFDSSKIGENTALRVQTIFKLYNSKIHLPFRPIQDATVNAETENRIKKSVYTLFLSRSFDHTMDGMNAEIEIAKEYNKPIILACLGIKGVRCLLGHVPGKRISIHSGNLDITLLEVAQYLRKSLNESIDSELSVLIVTLGLFRLACVHEPVILDD